ncbi:hypothetical protein SDC9_47365 [bioreactor metagenome]|uniref:Uncharacterized protein n=1 Tax=bioreactor metagenome TaxID=1076179 RepID=A0A644WC69_9ZZZZ
MEKQRQIDDQLKAGRKKYAEGRPDEPQPRHQKTVEKNPREDHAAACDGLNFKLARGGQRAHCDLSRVGYAGGTHYK